MPHSQNKVFDEMGVDTFVICHMLIRLKQSAIGLRLRLRLSSQTQTQTQTSFRDSNKKQNSTEHLKTWCKHLHINCQMQLP
jgi:hypothetical protein